MPEIICYCTGAPNSVKVVSAFAYGAKAPTARPPWNLPPKFPVFVHGKLRGTMDVVRAAKKAAVPFYMGDNGYFGQGFYRVTKNAMQLTDAKGVPLDMAAGHIERAAKTGVKLAPWRTTGSHILVCPPLPAYDAVMGFDGPGWLKGMLSDLGRVTDRPIRVRYRPGDPRLKGPPVPLAEDLKDCWALVTHDSNVAVDATIAGVPAFATGDSPVGAFPNGDVAAIETPFLSDIREWWLAWLAANQWTLDEMKSGKCWSDLKSI